MPERHKSFRCSKPLALACLYDTMEALRWKLVSANSEDGLLLVREPNAGIPFVIRVTRRDTGMIDISIDLASGEYIGWHLTETSTDTLFTNLQSNLDSAFGGENPSLNLSSYNYGEDSK